MASASPGSRGSVHFKRHSEGHPHTGVLAVARSDARHGVSRVALRLAAEAAAVPNAVGKRKRPLEVQDRAITSYNVVNRFCFSFAWLACSFTLSSLFACPSCAVPLALLSLPSRPL